MNNNTSSLCKGAAIVLLVLSFIGGILIGKSAESFLVALTCCISSFIFCLLLYAVGELIAQLVETNYHLSGIKNNIQNLGSENLMEDHEPKDGWVCKSCGKKNSRYFVECEQCGNSKFE